MDTEVKTTVVNLKNMRVDVWERARAAAYKNDMTLLEWVSEAICEHADRQAGAQIIAPSAPESHEQPMVDLSEAAALLTLMRQTGVPLRRQNASDINRLLSAALKPALTRLAPMIEAAPRGARGQWPPTGRMAVAAAVTAAA